MRRIFEFLCLDNHLSEAYIDDSERTIQCKECGKDARRIVSKPMMKLEGITGDYPTAYDAWERKHAEKLKEERSKSYAEPQ
jgi:hypothetical protein